MHTDDHKEGKQLQKIQSPLGSRSLGSQQSHLDWLRHPLKIPVNIKNKNSNHTLKNSGCALTQVCLGHD